MAARASFSNDSKIVKVPLPKSVLLKDYLLDDLSSCSSNGFRSYPRRQCFTTVRYLIEIDLNKHIKLPPTQKQFLKTKSQPKQKSKSKSKSKAKSSSALQRASTVVVSVFKNFQFSGSDKRRKPNFLLRNLSRKLSKHGFWKRTTDNGNKEFVKLNSFNEPIKEQENILRRPSKAPTAVTTTTVELKITSTSNSNSSVSSLDSYFSPTYDSSTTGSCLKINVAQNDVEENERQAKEKKKLTNGRKGAVATTTATKHSGNAKDERQSGEEDQYFPISVMDFSYGNDNEDEDEDEVTSPFQHSDFCVEGTKRKLMCKVQRIKSLAKLKPVRLEDRITLSESRKDKKAMALLQQLKATMCYHSLFESRMTENILLGYFSEKIMEGNVSNFTILQEAKNWMNGEVLESQITMLTYIIDMEKKVKWSKYEGEVETREIGLEVEYEVFSSLIHEMVVDFCVVQG